MMNFINNYRLSVAEATGNSNYGEAIARVILFPIFYLSAYLTDLLYKSTILESLMKGINKLIGNKEDADKGYIIDDLGRLHLGNSVPRYSDADDFDLLDEALERSIYRASKTGQAIRLGDMIEEIKDERR